jgi:uncharacterized protein (DUF486 family)
LRALRESASKQLYRPLRPRTSRIRELRSRSPAFSADTVHSMPSISPYLLPILLLIGSNVFMTLAWYGHLRFKEAPLAGVIAAAWLIAFVEYCMAVPANRWGSAVYTTAQLKTLQEVITLAVFAVFSVFYLKEAITWNHAIGFALLASGAFFIFRAPL